MNYEDVLQKFKALTLGYNEEFATIEIYEEEQLLFSVFESNPDNANWEFVEDAYFDMFVAISRVRGSQLTREKHELELL